MPLTAERIRQEVLEHMRAEQEKDLDFLGHQLDDNVGYALNTVSNPDDPTPYGGSFAGLDTYLDLWRAMYRTFGSYEIEVEEVIAMPEQNMGFATLKVTVVPEQEWYGLPAGQPIRWRSGALLRFDDDGHMLSETAFGSFPAIMEGYRRAREFAGEPRGG